MSSPRNSPQQPLTTQTRTGDEGFLLIGAIVLIALVMIALAIAAPRIARDLRREKDVEAVHRGNQYVRALQLYYRKFGRYPGSMDQLEKTNNIRFLRQRYTDPITRQDDFKIIPVGQNKTTVKTFFGAPLAGLPTAGLGSIASMVSPGIGIGANPGSAATGTTAPGATGTATAATGTAGATGPSATSTTAASGGISAIASGFGGTSSPSTPSTSSSPFGSSATPGGGLTQPFMGVTLGAKGDSIVEWNEQTDYGSWEFLYDPRLDQLKARAAALNGGGPGSAPGSSLGQPSIPTGLANGPFASPSTSPTSPSASPTGTAPPTQPANPPAAQP